MNTTPSDARELVTAMLAGDEGLARRCVVNHEEPVELAWQLLRLFSGFFRGSSVRSGEDPQAAWSELLMRHELSRIQS